MKNADSDLQVQIRLIFFGGIDLLDLLSPPPVFYDPQLQIICCYIARYYVRK